MCIRMALNGPKCQRITMLMMIKHKALTPSIAL
jgi:hypothetical protein